MECCGKELLERLACIIRNWNGSSWSSLGSGLAGIINLIPPVYVNALIVDNSDNLYVGGLFNMAGGKPASNIARCSQGCFRDSIPSQHQQNH